MKPLTQIFALACLLFTTVFPALAQPTTSTLTPSADAQLYTGASGTNYGSLTTSYLKVVSTTTRYRFIVKFDIASLGIPADAVIYSAELKLTPTATGEGGAGSRSFVLRTAGAAWSENTVTASTLFPALTANQVKASSVVSSKRTFDIKALVQDIVKGTTTNTGWMILRNPETTVTGDCQYNTREATTTGDRPQLTIVWYRPMIVTDATVTHVSNSGASDGAIDPDIAYGSGSTTYKWYNSSGTVISTDTMITGLGYGWYGLELTGQYGDKSFMAFLVGSQCETVSITFDPDADYIDDALIKSVPSASNFGTSTGIQASSWKSTVWYESRSLLRFRLWFDPGLTAVTADLHLSGSSHSTLGRTNNAVLEKVTQNWNETTVTYGNQPSATATVNADVPPTTGSADDKIIDMNAFWEDWKTDNTLNYGMLFRLDTYDTLYAKQEYLSSDTVSDFPYLTFLVDYPDCDRTSYTRFKSGQDAARTHTYQGRLKVQFTEEYGQDSGKKPMLALYDADKTMIASMRYDGTAVPGTTLLTGVTAYAFDDNRMTLDLTGLSLTANGNYLLELTRSTGEKEYIKFIYIN